MNDRQIVNLPEPDGPGTWLDAYMPDRQLGPHQAAPKLINIAVIRGLIYRQRWLIAGVIATALVLGLIATLLATPMYQATAKVSVTPYGQYVVEGQAQENVPSNMIGEYLTTLIKLIESRKLALAVVDDLDVTGRLDIMGKDIESQRAPGMTDQQWKESKRQMAASMLSSSVVADQSDGSWVIEIGFQSESPTLAAELANAYAEAFIASDTRNSVESNRYALEYLKEQIEVTRGKLESAEVVSNDYARDRSIIVAPVGGGGDDGDSSNGATLTTTKLASINEQYIGARAARIAAEQRWRSLQGLPASQIPEVLASTSLQALVSDLTAKRVQLADLRQRYNDDFPQIRNLLAQIDTINAQLERSSGDIKASVRNEMTIARNREQALEAELNGLTQETLSEQDQKVELSGLDREAQALRDQLRVLLDRFNEVSSAANVNPGTLQQLDGATVPGSPYSPNLLRNLTLALALGIAFAAGLAVLRETFDDRIRSLEDVEDKLGLPFLGHTPYVAERDISMEGSNRFSTLMEAYSSIRAAVDFSLPRTSNVIQLTSSQAGEGKSTTAVILAEMFASFGRKTLLVDADLRRPSVAGLLGIERPKVGVVEVVLGHVELDDAVVKGVHENLEILPVGEIPPNPSEILASKEFRQFIERCRAEYSLVIFDSCPVMGIADAPMLGRMVDATIFVLEANTLPFSRARASVRRLNAAGAKVIGAVLTKYRALEAGQSYDYQYSYYSYGGERE
jgi:capsular exopolysaccharide synthesis family protein